MALLKTDLLLPRWQVVAAVTYAAAFPLANLVDGKLLTVAFLATAPFLALGYLVGSIAVSIFGSQQAYPVGVFFATLIQVWLLLVLWNSRERKVHEAG
jgi:hypothetical protein